MIRKLLLVAGLSFASLQLQASPLACVVDEEYIFNGSMLDRGYLHRKLPDVFEKGAIGMMFTIDLEKSEFRGVEFRYRSYRGSDDALIHQLVSKPSKSMPITVITLKNHPEKKHQMVFSISEEMTTYTGHCQK